jgi:hypothetical protein
MKDPIKIIHKFKNNNRRIQHKVYIFIGSLISDDIMKILEKIKDNDFYTTLNNITKKDYKELEDFYGNKWYEYFFIQKHIDAQRELINNMKSKHKSLEDKFGKDWYIEHVKEAEHKKVTYSFATQYYDNLLYKNKIKTKKNDLDFRTHGDFTKFSASDIKLELKQLGGDDDDDQDTEKKEPVGEDEEEIDEEQFEEQVEEDFDLDELTKLYTTTDVESSKSINETSKLISEAINDKKWEKVAIEKKYDHSNDNIAYDTKIEDIFKKHYVTDQYIFKDDTIKTMRQKIAVSITISDKFGKSIKLLPESQYFWSEYNINKKTEQVMLGQKWVRRNELLKIDIVPNENIKVYEKLRNNLAYLKSSFGYKIKREDDETNIVRFYENFITMNEIYMLDIYNDLGLNYNPDQEEKRNLYDVYINIYFPLLSYERLEQIIQLLSGKNDKELQYIDAHFGTINNDIKLEHEIETVVEQAKMNLDKFDKLFSENHVIQSIIHVNIQDPKNITGTTVETKFNLYRIFDNFIVNDKYPFIQYQTPDSQITYKFYTENMVNQDILAKWFENAPYGIAFKIKIDDKNYISINLHETGRIEYKITWKEDDAVVISYITETYNFVRDLLKKINSENKKIKFILPTDDRFKYAFINTIQQFSIPEKFKIDHNDLSEFSRFFFPYVSLVIEPKKRKSKKQDAVDESSKYGTYLRYKRISKYDNRIKMHMRILYFLRNYELSDRELINEICNHFNIIPEFAAKELDYVRDKFQKVIGKSKKLLSKYKSMPKSKPPGVGIDIQGRDRERYKIRITGARNKDQLNEIINFIKVLIYLYIETYLYKKKEYQNIKNKLNSLTKIAKRRNKVIEIVEQDVTNQTVKSITSLDKDRLGFKPDKGQNQWTRSCQNSGNDKKRRPDITPIDQLEKLIKNGYKLNKESGYYEKKIDMKIKNKIYSTIIKAIKLPGADNTVNYFSCDPSVNQEHMYIGFLARGNNPNDLCMPCCFKKEQLTSANKEKKNYFMKCLGNKPNEEIDKTANILTDKLYILQDTNKIQDGRYIYLPKYLDIFFNKIWNHDHKIKNHYLLESKSGYFFKYTVKHDYYYFLSAIANIYDKTIEDLIGLLVKFIENDKGNKYFTYLNNGDICEMFKERKDFIEYIKTSKYLEYDIIGELTAIPGTVSAKGINYYILRKQTYVTKKALEKEKVKERYYLECLNPENYNYLDEDRDIIILIKEDNYYFPIYRVQKDEKINKKISLQKYFSEENLEKIIIELKKYHNKSCKNILINQIAYNNNLVAKNIILLLNNIKVTNQYIDDRHKCKYLELENGLIIPVKPSGISYEYNFSNIKNINNLLPLTQTIKYLENVNKILKLDYKPVSVFYDEKKDDNIKIISILLENTLTVPIKSELINEKEIRKMGLLINFQSLEETIDQEIINYNNQIVYDNRLKSVKEHNYMSESYNLFRLELSLYLNNNDSDKEKIIKIVRGEISTKEKKHELRKILLQILDSKLAKEYKENLQNGGGLVTLVNDIPKLDKYEIHNIRDYCENNNKDKCSTNLHCIWKNDSCRLQLLENVAIDFVNKVIEEMIQDEIKFKELIQENNYYVSDIVNYAEYTDRSKQQIIKATNYNIKKLMEELFGQNKVPIIGKKKIKSVFNVDEELPELIELGKQLIQPIITNKDSIIRAYINSYYWVNNPLYDIESRNLGYISELQTYLTYLFKADIIDFIQSNLNKGNENIRKYLNKYFKNDKNFFDSTLNKFRKTSYNTNGMIELFVLSHIIHKPIVVYDNYSNVKYLFLQGEIEVTKETIKIFTAEENFNKTIFLKFEFDNSSTIPKNIYSIYYL